MNRNIIHVDIPADMLSDLDTLAEIIRVNRSQLVRWMISDGIDEYRARIIQMEGEEESRYGQESVERRDNPV